MAGHLRKNANARFELDGVELSCGIALEVRVGDHWIGGRVEASPRLGYFWTDGYGVCAVLNGQMAVRLPRNRGAGSGGAP